MVKKKEIKKNKEVFVWECECGHREHVLDSPDECQKCLKLDSFMRLPHELSMEEDIAEDLE